MIVYVVYLNGEPVEAFPTRDLAIAAVANLRKAGGCEIRPELSAGHRRMRMALAYIED